MQIGDVCMQILQQVPSNERHPFTKISIQITLYLNTFLEVSRRWAARTPLIFPPICISPWQGNTCVFLFIFSGRKGRQHACLKLSSADNDYHIPADLQKGL